MKRGENKMANGELYLTINFQNVELVKQKFAEMQAEITRLQSEARWIPVEEKLPDVKKDTLFLCKFKDAQDNWKVDTKTFWAASSQFSGSCQIAYWMELPK